jgi:hypothetical protein
MNSDKRARGVELVTEVADALEAAGMERASSFNGGELVGWIPRNHFGSTGRSVKAPRSGELTWNVVISGKGAGLRYTSHREVRGDGDVIMLHEPDDPKAVRTRIRHVFEGLGYAVSAVRQSGYQTHWDDDVDYTVTTDRPAAVDRGAATQQQART